MINLETVEDELQKYATKKRDDLLSRCEDIEMKAKVLLTFHDAYYEHKRIFGSYKHLMSKQDMSYHDAMISRYDYMYAKGLKEILG